MEDLSSCKLCCRLHSEPPTTFEFTAEQARTTHVYTPHTAQTNGRTRNFYVHADPPVYQPLRAVDVQVSQADLAHALAHLARLLVAGDADFVAARLGVEEVVDEVEVLVVDLEVGLLLDFEVVEELVEVLMLFL